MENIVSVLKALSDETRFKIFITLLRRRICVRGLARSLEISEAAVSQHMKVLKNAGLIIGERRGHYIHYKVVEERVNELIDALGGFMKSEEMVLSSTESNKLGKVCQQMCHKSGEECMK